MKAERRRVVLLGGTGFIGRAVARRLVDRGDDVVAIVRAGSEAKLPGGVRALRGDVTSAASFAGALDSGTTLVALAGIAHPSPAKASLFRSFDLKTGLAAVQATRERQIRQLIYLSVAQPAPIMRAYADVRRQVEGAIVMQRLPATILRPLYVLGPGRQWPIFLAPLYWIAKRVPSLRESALRLDFVSLATLTQALVAAIDHPPAATQIWDVPRIKIESGGGQQ